MKDKKIILSIPLFTILLLTYGFIYLRTFYTSFNINVQDYFTINDYMSANIDNMYKVLGPLILFTPIWLIILLKKEDINGLIEGKQLIKFAEKFLNELKIGDPTSIDKLEYIENKMKDVEIKLNKTNKRLKFDIITPQNLIFLSAPFLLAGLYFTFLDKNIIRYLFYAIFSLFLFLAIINIMGDKGLFNELSFTDILVILFSVIVILNVYMYAKIDAAIILERTYENNVEIEFDNKFYETHIFVKENLFMIGSNSKYFFFYDKKNHNVYVVPSKSIEYVKYKNKKIKENIVGTEYEYKFDNVSKNMED